jgi:hypothetical protein
VSHARAPLDTALARAVADAFATTVSPGGAELIKGIVSMARHFSLVDRSFGHRRPR